MLWLADPATDTYWIEVGLVFSETMLAEVLALYELADLEAVPEEECVPWPDDDGNTRIHFRLRPPLAP